MIYERWLERISLLRVQSNKKLADLLCLDKRLTSGKLAVIFRLLGYGHAKTDKRLRRAVDDVQFPGYCTGSNLGVIYVVLEPPVQTAFSRKAACAGYQRCLQTR